MSMDGYRYWVERHKLLIALQEEKEALRGRPDGEAQARALELEAEFRGRLDALYGEARDEFKPSRESN